MERSSSSSIFVLQVIFILFFLNLLHASFAANRILLHKVSAENIQQLAQIINKKDPKPVVAAIDTLQFVSEHQDQNQINHVRMQQYYAGFAVLGGYAIFHQKASIAQTGVFYQGLRAELGLPPNLFVTHAKEVLGTFKKRFIAQPLSEEKVLPIVYIDDQYNAHWAYKVSLFTLINNEIPSRPTAIIDAATGREWVVYDDVKTRRTEIKGRGFGGNRLTGQYEYGANKPLLLMSRDEIDGLCYMENKQVKVIDMGHRYEKNNEAMAYACSNIDSEGLYWTGYLNDGYDLVNDSYSPSNDALYIGEMVKNMYRDWYNEEALTLKRKPMQLVMRVHYGYHYENAFWDGRQMTFGDGDKMTYSMATLGVGAHEVSHGFTEQHADLVYYGQSGGMNEAFSDMASIALEYYATGASSWLIGADVLKPESGLKALRFMDKPSRDGRSIDVATNYRKGLDVHYSSGVYNHLFYLLANTPGWNPRLAFNVMMKANMDYWIPTSTFIDGACGVIYAAHDLNLSFEDVKQALDLVKIDYTDC